jgi:hypothetical protein
MALRTLESGSIYGRYNNRAAMVRPNGDGTWRVTVNDPANRESGHDGWRVIGTHYESAEAAVAATGVS